MYADDGRMIRLAWKPALTMAAFAVIGVGLVILVHDLSASRIEQNQRDYLMRSLESLVAAGSYDNDFVADVVEVIDPEYLGSKRPVRVFRARKDGDPVAVIITARAVGGYNGNIGLMIGITADGVVTGVRVLSHRETPGLGDRIEREKSDWILQFDGRSLKNTDETGWHVKRDGGQFDQLTGATVTPRAVISAVHLCLQFFELHHRMLFDAPIGSITDFTNEQ